MLPFFFLTRNFFFVFTTFSLTNCSISLIPTMSSQQLSSSPPSSSSLSEHKPIPPTQSKVHSLARRYSAMAKQNAQGGTTLSTPAKPAGVGKVSPLLNKYRNAGPDAAKTAAPLQTTATPAATPAAAKVEEHPISEKTVEEEIESDLQVTEPSTASHNELAEEEEEGEENAQKVEELPAAAASNEEPHSDLVDVPLSKADEEEEKEEEHQRQEDDVQAQQKEEEKEPITDKVPELEQALKEVEITKKDEEEEEHAPAPVSTEDKQEPSVISKPSDEATDKPSQTIEKNDEADQA